MNLQQIEYGRLLTVFIGPGITSNIVNPNTWKRPQVFHDDRSFDFEPHYPERQQTLVLNFVEALNVYNELMVLTTHSPYVLSQLNNCLYAYQVGQLDPERTEKIMPRCHWLNPDDVRAYFVDGKGNCRTIMDNELKQIKVEEIDIASQKTNEIYDQLFNLDKS